MKPFFLLFLFPLIFGAFIGNPVFVDPLYTGSAVRIDIPIQADSAGFALIRFNTTLPNDTIVVFPNCSNSSDVFNCSIVAGSQNVRSLWTTSFFMPPGSYDFIFDVSLFANDAPIVPVAAQTTRFSSGGGSYYASAPPPFYLSVPIPQPEPTAPPPPTIIPSPPPPTAQNQTKPPRPLSNMTITQPAQEPLLVLDDSQPITPIQVKTIGIADLIGFSVLVVFLVISLIILGGVYLFHRRRTERKILERIREHKRDG